jgi:hypothetical protein
MDIVLKQFVVPRGDMPRLNFAAQVLIEHRRKQKVIRVTNKRDVGRSGELEGRKHSPETASENQNFRF